MKKSLSCLLVGLFLLSGCTPKPAQTPAPTPTPAPVAAYTAGTYSAVATGHNGELTLDVTVDGTRITDVTVAKHAETVGIADFALEQIPAAIVDGQTLQIDTLTGATITSAAILTAAEDCLTQAGGDIAALKANGAPKVPQDETLTCDLVVAGAGAAGLSAAYEAATAGAKVLVVEKQAIPGGSTARSGGSILAAGTKLQASLGVEDSPEAFAQFLIARGEGHVNEEKLTLIAKNSSSTIDWLTSLGVTFAPELQSLHPTLVPSRGHSAKDHAGIASGAGGEITSILYRSCVDAGVTFLFEAPATRLTTENGAVTGLIAEKRDGSQVTVCAKGVILATGGFDKNPEYTAKYTPFAAASYSTVPNGNVGDGLRMAEEVGAQIVAGGGAVTLYMDFFTGSGESGGLYVLGNGERFMDESSFWFVRTKTMMDLQQKVMFYITDETTDAKGIYDKVAGAGKIYTADSIEALAQQIGMDPATLSATVERYNAQCAQGVDKDFGKPAEKLVPVSGSKFYAIPFGPTSSGTFGGPITDLSGHVLTSDGTAIKGLYAAGEVSNGDLLWQEYPGSGTSLSICFTFGRIVGQSAAADVAK